MSPGRLSSLSSDAAGYITGALIPVDGGTSAWGTRSRRKTSVGILEGKSILVAGVTLDTSIGFHVAKIAQARGGNGCGLQLRQGDEPDRPSDQEA